MTDPDFDPPEGTAPQDFRCSIIRYASDTATKPIGFRDVISGIRSGRWGKQVAAVRSAYAEGLVAPAIPKEVRGRMETPDEARERVIREHTTEPKHALPGVLFSGEFSVRNEDSLIRHSGLICADLDHLGDRATAIKDQIAGDSHCIAAFISPSGTGVKAVFRCDETKPHEDAFEALDNYIHANFGLMIDVKCADVSRICFVSHDPEAFVSDSATPLPYIDPATRPPPKEYKPRPVHAPGADVSTIEDYNTRGGIEVPDLLEKHGWTKAHRNYWTRPGKSKGISASWGYYENTLIVHSDSPMTGFPPDQKGFDPFAVYSYLEHNGDNKAAARSLHQKGYGSRTKSRQQQTLDRVAGPEPTPVGPTKPLFSLPLHGDTDASILLGNRYLSRGDGAVLSSSSGMGKSAMAIQVSTLWALGRPAFGIRPHLPMRILYIQSEDSEGDMAEVTASMCHGLSLTKPEIEALNERLHVVTDRVNRGAKFLTALRAHIATHKPDLVILNPLQAFIDGDITQSQDLGRFLREGLNALNEPAAFAYLLIHHTTKPATGKERSDRLWHEVMYDMAGGAEIINWARAILSLRAAETEGEFNLVLAKRGKRAGVTKEVAQGVGTRAIPVTTIPLRHSQGTLPSGQPLIFWEAREATQEEPKKSKGGGRPPSHHFEDYVRIFPTKDTPGLPLGQLLQRLAPQRPISKNALYTALQRWAKDGDVEIVPQLGRDDFYRKAL